MAIVGLVALLLVLACMVWAYLRVDDEPWLWGAFVLPLGWLVGAVAAMQAGTRSELLEATMLGMLLTFLTTTICLLVLAKRHRALVLTSAIANAIPTALVAGSGLMVAGGSSL